MALTSVGSGVTSTVTTSQTSGFLVLGGGSEIAASGGTATTTQVQAGPSVSVGLRLEEHFMPKKMTEIAFIDPRVDDSEVLLAGLRPEVEGVLLDARDAAPRQMARALAGRRDVKAIHVVAHGAPGRVSFAAGEWSADTLADHAADFAAIGRALGEGGGLLAS